MRERGPWLVLVAALAAVALAAAGCGDEKSSSAETTVAATETTEPTTTEEATTAGTTTETVTETETVAAGTIADKDCVELASVSTQFSQAVATGQGTNYTATAAFFATLANKAPDEIKDDIKTLSAAWVKLAEALKGIDLKSGQVPSAETIAKLQKLSQTLDTPELQKATNNLEAWAKKHCGTTTP